MNMHVKVRAQNLKEEAQSMTMEDIDQAVASKEITEEAARSMRLQLRARETRARFAAAAKK